VIQQLLAKHFTSAYVWPVPDRNQGGGKLRNPLRYAGLGVEIAPAVLLGVLAGGWLDRKTGAHGIFTIVGAFAGFGATLYGLIRTLGKPGRDGD
jgi:F0F1-type ATP synthase assembly protein I